MQFSVLISCTWPATSSFTRLPGKEYDLSFSHSQVAFVLVQIFHYLKITVSQLLVIIDCYHLFIFFYYYLPYLFACIYLYYIC